MTKEIPKKYNGQFIIDEKLNNVVQDLLVVLEKWNLRQMEKEIALQQATQHITLIKRNQINASHAQTFGDKMKDFFNKAGIGEDN